MKTSFYFLLWIIIYPILGLFNSAAVNEFSFILAMIIVFGISSLSNRFMGETIAYERALSTNPIKEDLYTDNIADLRHRLSRTAIIMPITALYFLATTIVLIIARFMGSTDYFALGVFALFTCTTTMAAFKAIKGYHTLKNSPTPEDCQEIVNSVYNIDYSAYLEYYNVRQTRSYQDMFPPRPRHYTFFQWFSIIVAAIVALLAAYFILSGIVAIIAFWDAPTMLSVAWLYLLYGTLALYYSIKDLVSSIATISENKK